MTGFFYNPNIHPEEEYKKRLENVKILFAETGTPLIEGKYNSEEWHRRTKGLEKEKEGGKRCTLCFSMRLEEASKEAQKRNIQYFTTTLTVSPHKKSLIINSIGELLDRDSFIVKDFKKKDGFKRAMDLSKKYNLYHQNYCGCAYSIHQPNTEDIQPPK